DSDPATEEEEVQDNQDKNVDVDVVENSQTEESIEKIVSIGNEDTESGKTAPGDQMIDLDKIDSMYELQTKTVPRGVGRRLRSRKS
ncbi:hypothetical protein A2U01_0085147, partial [Trifolium medium]|nr:hypothetical protein [Trifolium medium]